MVLVYSPDSDRQHSTPFPPPFFFFLLRFWPSYHSTHFLTVFCTAQLYLTSTAHAFNLAIRSNLLPLTKTLSALQVPVVSGAAPPSISTLWKSTEYQLKLRGSPQRRHSRLAAQSSKPHLLCVTSAHRLQGINPSKATHSTRRSRSFTTRRQTARCQALMVRQSSDGTPTVLPSSILRGTVQINTPQ